MIANNSSRISYFLYDLQNEIKSFVDSTPEEVFVVSAANNIAFFNNLFSKKLNSNLSSLEKVDQINTLFDKIFELTNRIIDDLIMFRKQCVYHSKKVAIDEKDIKNGFKNRFPFVYENFDQFCKIKDQMMLLFHKFEKIEILRSGLVVEEYAEESSTKKKVSILGLYSDCLANFSCTAIIEKRRFNSLCEFFEYFKKDEKLPLNT